MTLSEQLREQAIPRFRHAYLRLADLDAIAVEHGADRGDAGRNGPACSTIRHVLTAAAQIRLSANNPFSRDSQRSGAAPPASYFCRVLEQELLRVRRFAESFAEELWVRLGTLFESLEGLWSDMEGKGAVPLPVDRVNLMPAQCDQIGDDLILLDEFLRQNVIASAYIAQKHDSQTSGSQIATPTTLPQINPAYLQAMENYLMGGIMYDPILVGLSDAYCQLKAIRNQVFGQDAVWNAPEVFERKTVKYWVHPADVLRLKCDVIKHLPILIYGKGKGKGGATSRLSSLKEQTQRDGTLISSVYFDNGSLQTYHDRLRREHGSSLMRIRWYGKRALTNDMETFVERKIHRDSWTGGKSVKERAPMPASQTRQFLNLEHVPALESEGYKGDLLQDIQKRVANRNEEPSIRTEYVRVAFQESTNNEVRISLDTSVRMIREKGVPSGSSGWCRDVTKLQPKDVVHFPYGIFELKVASEEPPEWVQDLLDSGMLVEVPKFSKFLHGSALLFGDSVRNSPFWFVPDGKNRFTPATIAEMSDPYDEFAKKSSDCLFPEPISKKRLSSPIGNVRRNLSTPVSPQKMQVSTMCNVPNGMLLSEVVVLPPLEARGAPRQVIQTSLQRNSGCDLNRAHSNQLSTFALRVGQQDMMSSAEKTNGSCAARKPSWVGKEMGKARGDPNPSGDPGAKYEGHHTRAAALVRTRIEPKTFFANERTFLSWMTIAVMVMFMGLSLLDGSNLVNAGVGGSANTRACEDHHSCQVSRISGALISPVALILMGYALYMYRKRTMQILRRETVRFDDQRGPIIVTVLLLGALIVAFAVSASYNLF